MFLTEVNIYQMNNFVHKNIPRIYEIYILNFTHVGLAVALEMNSSVYLNKILMTYTDLKEYSVILTTSFYGMNQKIQTKKAKLFFPKFQLIPILGFQIMYDYVCFIAPTDYCVE